MLQTEIEENGFAIREGVLSAQEIATLLAAIDRIDQAASVRKRGGVFAVRNLLDISPEVGACRFSARPCADRANSRTGFFSSKRNPLRQDSRCELEGSLASGCDDCDSGESRS